MHRGHAVPVVLHYADSRLPVVPGQKQAAEGQDPVHRRPQDGHHGDPQAAGADRRGYPQAGRHLQRLCGRHPGGCEGLLRRGHHGGDRQAGLHPHPRPVCGHRGAAGRRRALRGEDDPADKGAVGDVPAVPRVGGADQGAAEGDWV